MASTDTEHDKSRTIPSSVAEDADAMGRLHAESGVTLSALESARTRDLAVRSIVPPQGRPSLPDVVSPLSSHWSQLVDAYVRRLSRLTTFTEASRQLTDLLLDGPPPGDAVAAHAYRRFAREYHCLAVRTTQFCSSARVLRLRRNVQELVRDTDGMLIEASPVAVTVVVPAASDDGQAADPLFSRMICEVITTTEAPAKAGRTSGAPPLRQSVATAHQIAVLTPASRRPESISQLTDVLLEAAMSRSPDLDASLQEVLSPLRDTPDLLTTLRELYDNDLRRARTAGQLRVHPRTLDYRLAKIRRLSGIDPTSVHGIALFQTALKRLDCSH